MKKISNIVKHYFNKKNIKNYILLLLHFFYICYFIYSNKDIGNESYTKLLSFLSLETLIISIFFIFKTACLSRNLYPSRSLERVEFKL